MHQGTFVRRIADQLDEAYWPIPAGCVVVAGLLAFGLIQLDESLQRGGVEFAFTGGPDSARSLLSTMAASMLTLTALVFSITIVALQLASSQFSPRALRTFLRDRQSQFALGVFLATFVFALVTLREVRGQDGLAERFVPGVTISVAFLLVVVCVALFVNYIHHIAQSVRIVTIVERVADETRRAIERVHPDEPDSSEVVVLGNAARVVEADRHGSVVEVNADRLVDLAVKADAMVTVLPRVGDFVPEGTPLLRVSGGSPDEDDLRAAIGLARERNGHRDVGFGLRQLVDIAERALSPGMNDPSTAVQCLDQLHDLLRRLVNRPYPSGVHRDESGAVRVVAAVPQWEDHVGLALDEIRLWGRQSLQIRRRMQALVDDLLAVAEGERRQPLLKRLPLWTEALPRP